MDIIEALKTQFSVRLSNGHRWLVWNDNGFWSVYERKPYARKTTTLIETTDEAQAVEILIED